MLDHEAVASRDDGFENHRPPEVIAYGAPKWHVTLLISKAPSLEEFGGKIPNQRTSVGPTQSHMKLL